MAHFSLSGSENETYLLALHLRQCGFGLGEPEGHVHGAVQVDGGGQGGAGRRSTAGLVVQPGQSDRTTAAEPHGQTTRLSVTRLPFFIILGLDLLSHQLLPHGQHCWLCPNCLQTGPDGARIAFEFGKGQQEQRQVAPVSP